MNAILDADVAGWHKLCHNNTRSAVLGKLQTVPPPALCPSISGQLGAKPPRCAGAGGCDRRLALSHSRASRRESRACTRGIVNHSPDSPHQWQQSVWALAFAGTTQMWRFIAVFPPRDEG